MTFGQQHRATESAVHMQPDALVRGHVGNLPDRVEGAEHCCAGRRIDEEGKASRGTILPYQAPKVLHVHAPGAIRGDLFQVAAPNADQTRVLARRVVAVIGSVGNHGGGAGPVLSQAFDGLVSGNHHGDHVGHRTAGDEDSFAVGEADR